MPQFGNTVRTMRTTVQDQTANRPVRIWGTETRAFSLAEVVADGVVHGIGIAIAAVLGSVLLGFAAFETAPGEVPALAV